MQLILLYSLEDGVRREDFHDWVRAVDYPAMRGLSRVESFKTYETKKLLTGAGTPSVAYVEVFEIPDFDGFMREDLIGEKVQNIMGQFMGFAHAPEFHYLRRSNLTIFFCLCICGLYLIFCNRFYGYA